MVKVDDAVFGDLSGLGKNGWGGFAEYVCAPENALTPKPDDMSYEQAAALPQAGTLALQGLRDKGHIQKGQKLLINGASGGVGTLAIQMAKAFGVDEITAVCSASKMETVKALGIKHIIDYTQQDFTRLNDKYDLILDVKGYHSIFDYRRALAPNGVYVMLGGGSASIAQVMFLGPLLSAISKKKIRMLFLKPNKGLNDIVKLFEEGKLNPVIDKVYPLEETAQAMAYYGEGKAKGKVVISIPQ